MRPSLSVPYTVRILAIRVEGVVMVVVMVVVVGYHLVAARCNPRSSRFDWRLGCKRFVLRTDASKRSFAGRSAGRARKLAPPARPQIRPHHDWCVIMIRVPTVMTRKDGHPQPRSFAPTTGSTDGGRAAPRPSRTRLAAVPSQCRSVRLTACPFTRRRPHPTGCAGPEQSTLHRLQSGGAACASLNPS